MPHDPDEVSLFQGGNGSVRTLRIVSIIGGCTAAFIAIVSIMWWIFSLVSGATSQPAINEKILARLAVLEIANQAVQLQMNGHELRITSLRTEIDATHLTDARFQEDIRSSIARVTEIVTGVRLDIAKGMNAGHK